jgi:hypothetical protein
MLPFVCGGLTVLLLAVLYRTLTGTWSIWRVVVGADGRASASKLQWFLWTVVVIFSYVAVYSLRASRDHFEAIEEIPSHLLTIMGFSLTTMAAAKGITASYVAAGRVAKTPVSASGGKAHAKGPGGIVLDDEGFPDLSKIQMMAWTLIAIGIYLINLYNKIRSVKGDSPLPQLPDIDASLMVLMGLGQGAYLGKKLTTTDVPRLTGLSRGSASPGDEVTLSGLSFGESPAGGLITLDRFPVVVEGLEWTDVQIKFRIPASHPNGTPWATAPARVLIGLIANGIEGANELPLTVVRRE